MESSVTLERGTYGSENIFGLIQSEAEALGGKNKKWPLYCPQGSGTLRQQFLMMHGIAWYFIVLHGIAWYCMVLHGIAWHCMVLHGIAWYCMVLHDIAWYCMVLHCIA